MYKTILLFLAVLSTIWAIGVQADQSEIRYDSSNPPPDNVALRLFLRGATRFDDAHKRNHRVLDIRSNIEFETYDDAQDFLDLLVQVNSQLNADRQSYMRETLCPFDKPRPTGRGVYGAMNSLRDYGDSRATFYLTRIRQELGPKRYQQFQSWLDERKKGMTISRSDYGEQHKNQDPDIVRQNICSRVASM